MGVQDTNRILSIEEGSSNFCLEIGNASGRQQFLISTAAGMAVAEVLNQQPFRDNNNDEYTYWLHSVERTLGRDYLFFRGKDSDFRIAIRIKRGRSRLLVTVSCMRDDHEALSSLFPGTDFDA